MNIMYKLKNKLNFRFTSNVGRIESAIKTMSQASTYGRMQSQIIQVQQIDQKIVVRFRTREK